jgi:UDP-N-acetylglucosamine--N-acetylmuramyl-(pentapeptide) pyrophosphoryl-undecaprenol N-acetylglucosamine transferase
MSSVLLVKIHEFEARSSPAKGLSVKKIVFAGAGTAGHVEPALAVARWFRESAPEVEVIFLGTAEGVETRLVPEAGFALRLISKSPFPRKLSLSIFNWPLRFKRTFREVQELLIGADLVIGFGGYVAAPAYLAARQAGIPIIAHEANAKMGLANKLALRCNATMLYAFSGAKEDRVGIPLRPVIVELAKLSQDERLTAKRAALRGMNLDPKASTILVFGGSLGSVKFNAAIMQAQRDISRLGIQIIHAVGEKNVLPIAQAGYFPVSYIKDMAAAYSACDLVIARSGAVTVAETGVLGIYTLYVPLPIGNGEQRENAKVVVNIGGGEVIDNAEFSAEWLVGNVERMLSHAKRYASSEIAKRALKVLTNG